MLACDETTPQTTLPAIVWQLEEQQRAFEILLGRPIHRPVCAAECFKQSERRKLEYLGIRARSLQVWPEEERRAWHYSRRLGR